MSNKEAVRALLKLVAITPTAQLPLLLQSLTKLSSVSTFAEQLEASRVATTLHSLCEDLLPGAARDWGIFPEKLLNKVALAEALPGLCTALLGGSFAFFLSAIKSRLLFCILDASSNFMRGANLTSNGEGETIAYLEGSLKGYAVFLQKIAGTPFAGNASFRDAEALKATGRWFLRAFQKLQRAGEQLERASPRVVSLYKTTLVTCLEAWASSGVVYRISDKSDEHLEAVRKLLPRLEEPLRETFELRLKICEAVFSDRKGKAQATGVGSLENVKWCITKLITTEGEREQALKELQAPDCFEVLQAYLIANERGGDVSIQGLFTTPAVASAADLLMSSADVTSSFALKLLDALLRGTDLLGQSPEVLFRGLGFRTLAWAELLDVRKLSAEDCAALLRVLMTCFASGGEQGVHIKRTALVKVILKHALKRHSEPAVSILAWHFLSVVLEDKNQIGSYLIDRWDPHSLRDGLKPLCKKPPVMPTDCQHNFGTWLDLDEATRDEIVVCALEALARTLSLKVEHRTDWTPNWGDCGRVLDKCVRDERLIRDICRPRVPLLLTSLSDAMAVTYEQLGNGSDIDYLEIGSVLFVLLTQSCTHSETEFAETMQGLDDVARVKGAFLSVLAVRGFQRGLYDVPPARAHREWLEMLRGLMANMWGIFAEDLGLEECSNPECSEGVLEAVKCEFKKCAVCERVQYCSRNCQKVHWKKEHRDNCKRS